MVFGHKIVFAGCVIEAVFLSRTQLKRNFCFREFTSQTSSARVLITVTPLPINRTSCCCVKYVVDRCLICGLWAQEAPSLRQM